jgi:hypothetical protein
LSRLTVGAANASWLLGGVTPSSSAASSELTGISAIRPTKIPTDQTSRVIRRAPGQPPQEHVEPRWRANPASCRSSASNPVDGSPRSHITRQSKSDSARNALRVTRVNGQPPLIRSSWRRRWPARFPRLGGGLWPFFAGGTPTLSADVVSLYGSWIWPCQAVCVRSWQLRRQSGQRHRTGQRNVRELEEGWRARI